MRTTRTHRTLSLYCEHLQHVQEGERGYFGLYIGVYLPLIYNLGGHNRREVSYVSYWSYPGDAESIRRTPDRSINSAIPACCNQSLDWASNERCSNFVIGQCVTSSLCHVYVTKFVIPTLSALGSPVADRTLSPSLVPIQLLPRVVGSAHPTAHPSTVQRRPLQLRCSGTRAPPGARSIVL